MRCVVLSLLASLAFGGPAIAAHERAERAPAPHCMKIEEFKKQFDAKTHFEVLGPGAFHFVEGLYVGSPATPEGMPPGDGAIIATHKGAPGGILIWTHRDEACAPLPINAKLVRLIPGIKTAPGETAEDNGDELHL